MKDRIPTQVVNGAIRMEQLDENGNHVGYIYLKRADEPIEEGTPLNTLNLLTDETAEALGISAAANPSPNHAFAKIAGVMRKKTSFETIYSETFSATQSVERVLDVDLFQYDQLLIQYTVDNNLSSLNTLGKITAYAGKYTLGSERYSGIANATGWIYFDNSSPIKLFTKGVLGVNNTPIPAFGTEYIDIKGEEKNFRLVSDKNSDTLAITGFTIYGNRVIS